jgi:murein hydrolase activator
MIRWGPPGYLLTILVACGAVSVPFVELSAQTASPMINPGSSATKKSANPPPPPKAADRLRTTKKMLDVARGKTEALQKKANTLDQDIQRIREGLVGAARVIHHLERRIGELESQLTDLGSRQQGLTQMFKARRGQLGQVLAALQRMARNPPEALIAQPVPPADMVRSAILLRAVLPRLKGEAEMLGRNLSDLADAREEAQVRRKELDGELDKLHEQRQILKRLLGRKSRLRRRTVLQTSKASKKAEQLAGQAASLQDLVARLSQIRALQNRRKQSEKSKSVQTSPANPTSVAARTQPSTRAIPRGFNGKPFESGKGKLPFPVVGRVVARYGQAIASGRIHMGLTIETTALAQVIAPYEGKVVFSGTFRGYGQLLIIEHSGGYHTLLAGMARIDASVGQWLMVGEPVGIMGRAKKISAKGNQRQGRLRVQRPALYVEFRRTGQPIDPLAWLAARKGKVSG